MAKLKLNDAEKARLEMSYASLTQQRTVLQQVRTQHEKTAFDTALMEVLAKFDIMLGALKQVMEDYQ